MFQDHLFTPLFVVFIVMCNHLLVRLCIEFRIDMSNPPCPWVRFAAALFVINPGHTVQPDIVITVIFTTICGIRKSAARKTSGTLIRSKNGNVEVVGIIPES